MRFFVCVFLMLIWAEFAFAAKPNKPVSTVDREMAFIIVRSNSSNCEPNCPQWIAADGKIVGNTAAKFSRLLANPANRLLPVVLNSGGGDISAALTIGRLIRRYHMDTGIGRTYFSFCDPTIDTKCKPTVSNRSYRGYVLDTLGYCFSACPLILLGGETRVVGNYARLGLHQPVSVSHPYMDRYWETYRIVHGRKQIIARKFIKRITLPTKTSVGVTPQLRSKLVRFINEMKASPKIVDEMKLAAPTDMHLVLLQEAIYLGLATTPPLTLENFTADRECAGPKPSPHCIPIK
jgi:hypothetical protein